MRIKLFVVLVIPVIFLSGCAKKKSNKKSDNSSAVQVEMPIIPEATVNGPPQPPSTIAGPGPVRTPPPPPPSPRPDRERPDGDLKPVTTVHRPGGTTERPGQGANQPPEQIEPPRQPIGPTDMCEGSNKVGPISVTPSGANSRPIVVIHRNVLSWLDRQIKKERPDQKLNPELDADSLKLMALGYTQINPGENRDGLDLQGLNYATVLAEIFPVNIKACVDGLPQSVNLIAADPRLISNITFNCSIEKAVAARERVFTAPAAKTYKEPLYYSGFYPAVPRSGLKIGELNFLYNQSSQIEANGLTYSSTDGSAVWINLINPDLIELAGAYGYNGNEPATCDPFCVVLESENRDGNLMTELFLIKYLTEPVQIGKGSDGTKIFSKVMTAAIRGDDTENTIWDLLMCRGEGDERKCLFEGRTVVFLPHCLGYPGSDRMNQGPRQ